MNNITLCNVMILFRLFYHQADKVAVVPHLLKLWASISYKTFTKFGMGNG